MGKGGENYGRKEGSRKWSKDPNQYAAWAKDVKECERNYEVDSKSGLSDGEVKKRLLKYGSNELEKHEGQSIWRLVLDQFNDTLVRILLAAAVISFVLAWKGSWDLWTW